eukprot:1646080-Pyramimonas_sp.AAC.1
MDEDDLLTERALDHSLKSRSRRASQKELAREATERHREEIMGCLGLAGGPRVGDRARGSQLGLMCTHVQYGVDCARLFGLRLKKVCFSFYADATPPCLLTDAAAAADDDGAAVDDDERGVGEDDADDGDGDGDADD